MNIKTTVETQQDETERNKIWKKKMNRASVSSGITSGGLVNVSVGFWKERKEKRWHEKFWRKSGWKLFKFDENHEQDTRNPMDPRQRSLIFPMPGSQLAYDQCLINEWANCRLRRLSPCCLPFVPFLPVPFLLLSCSKCFSSDRAVLDAYGGLNQSPLILSLGTSPCFRVRYESLKWSSLFKSENIKGFRD